MNAIALIQTSRIVTGVIAAGVPLMFADLRAMSHEDGEKMAHDKTMMKKPSYSKLIALINPVGDSKVRGTVVFEKVDEGVKVTASIGGLTPNSRHGFHVHQFGDLGSEDASSAGDHFNPGGHPHGLTDKTPRHAGDLGNLEADQDGKANFTITVQNLDLCAGDEGILGRAVIVHAKEDDGGQPTGNAGDRIGAGVIGVSKDAKIEFTDKSKAHMDKKMDMDRDKDKEMDKDMDMDEETESE